MREVCESEEPHVLGSLNMKNPTAFQNTNKPQCFLPGASVVLVVFSCYFVSVVVNLISIRKTKKDKLYHISISVSQLKLGKVVLGNFCM